MSRAHHWIVVLTLLSKQTRKNFQVIIAFGQSINYITITVCSYEHAAEKVVSLSNTSKCQPNSNESCLFIRTYTYKIDAGNQLHNCVCAALSIKMAVL